MSSSNVEREKDAEEQEPAAKIPKGLETRPAQVATDKETPKQTIRIGFLEITKPLEVQRGNSNSPLHLIKSFDELLKPALVKGFEVLGYNSPSEIQAIALPYLLADPPQNMIAQYQTEAQEITPFVLAMLSKVDTSKMYPQILYLASKYQLAEIEKLATNISKFCPEIKLKLAIPALEIAKESKIEEHVVLGTPGEVFNLSSKFKLFDLKNISVLVLDEADVMIPIDSYQVWIVKILKVLPETCQMIFFSARENEKVMNLAKIFVDDPIIIRQLKEEEVLNNIKKYCIRCKDKHEKYQVITNIYGVNKIGQAIIFCNTKDSASWLDANMSRDGYSVAILSSDLKEEERINVLNRFRDGLIKVLITSRINAKEILVEPVSIIVNYDIPLDDCGIEDDIELLNRIVKTGPSGKYGIAINLIDLDRTWVFKNMDGHFRMHFHYLNAENANEINKIGA